MIRKKAKPKKPRKFKHDKPAGMSFSAKAPLPETPALDAFLRTPVGHALEEIFLAVTDPTTADDLAQQERRDASKDDDRIVVKVT